MTIWYNILQYDYIWWYFEIHDPWANRTSWWHLCSSVAFLCLAQNSHRSCHSFRTISTLDTLQRDTKRINHVRSLISQITVTLGQTTCTACTSSICKTLQNCLAGIGNGSFSSVPTQLLRLQHLTPKSWGNSRRQLWTPSSSKWFDKNWVYGCWGSKWWWYR